MNGLSEVYGSEVPSYGWYSDITGKTSKRIAAREAKAGYLDKGQKYYEDFVNSLDDSNLAYGTPTDYIRDADHAFDEYARRDGHLMHVGLYGYDPDGTAAEWATQALQGPNEQRLANIGRLHYGKFGKGEGRELLAPGYYDAQGNRIRPQESSALNEILSTRIEDAPYQEYEPGLNFLTDSELEDRGVELNDLMRRNMSLRPEKYMRKAAPQQFANDYIEYLKDEGNKDLMDAFRVQMNLTPELVGTSDTDKLRSLMELYGASSFLQGAGNPDVKMPTLGLEQVFQYSPERKTDNYVANLKRLYQNRLGQPQETITPKGYDVSTRYRGPSAITRVSKDGNTLKQFGDREEAAQYALLDSIGGSLEDRFKQNPISESLAERYNYVQQPE